MPAKKKAAAPAKVPAKAMPAQASPPKVVPRPVAKADYLEKVRLILQKKLTHAHVGRAGDGSALSEVRSVVPSGIDVLDKWVIGRGGLPGGRLVEIFGDESSGKTALVLAIIAAFQRANPDGFAELVDSEHSYETPRAQTFEVDTDKLLLVQPLSHDETRDTILSTLAALPDDGPPGILVWDSVAGNAPETEMVAIEKDKDARVGEAARINNFICRNAIPLAARKNVTLVFVNQTRMKIGVVFGDPTTTTGGRAIPFFSAVRLQLWGGKAIKVGDNAVGRFVTIKAFKNKIAPPWRKAKLRLDFGLGWDNQWSTLNRAKDLKLIPAGAKGHDAFVTAHAALEACKWGASMALEPHVEPVTDEDGYEPPPSDDDATEEV